MKSLHIAGNLLTPVVNGVEWTRLLDRHSPNTPVLSSFSFTSGFVSHEVISDDVNGLDLSEDVVLVNTTQTIYGHITFKSDVTVTGPEGVLMDEGVTVNNVDISRLLDNAQGTGKLMVSEPVTFNDPLTCSGDINAVNINGLPMEGIEKRYWRKSVPQVIDVPVKLGHVEFMEAVTSDTLNGLQMTDFLTYDTPQQITGTYEFRRPVKLTDDLQLGVGTTVNGVNVVALGKNTVTLHGDQTIDGTMEGSQVTVGTLDLSGTLNGVDPRTGYLRLDRTVQHTDKLTFLGKTVATQMTLAGNLRVETLNGLRVEDAARGLVLQDQDATIHGSHTLHLTANTTVVSLDVSGALDGVNVKKLMSSALLKTPSHGTLQEVTGHLHVTGAVHFANSLNLNSANGKDFTSHLQNVVSRGYSGLITGKKTFLKTVNVLGNLDATSINGVDLREFASQVFTKTSDQEINAHYNFASSITIEHLSTPTINNITISQVLLVDTPGHLTGTTTFLAPLTVRGHLKSASTKLAGCDLSTLTDMSLERGSDGSLHVYGPLRVENLYVNGTLNSPGGVWVGNSVNLDTFLGSLVLKSKPQKIYGSVEFLSHVTVQLMYAKTINNVDVSQMFMQSLQYDEVETIRCNLKFEHPITVERLVVRGPVDGSSGQGLLVGGVNVSLLDAEAVRDQGGDIIVTGHKIFANGLTSHNLIINDLVDGVPVSDLVTLSGGRIVEAATFMEPITVSGDLKVNGLVDGVDLDHVFTSRINLLNPREVGGKCSFHALRVLGNLDVEVINDVALTDLVVREGRPLQVIEGPKTFAGGLVVNGAIKTSLLNGVDVVAMNRSLLRLDKPIIITNSVRFASVVVAERAVGGGVQGHDARNLSYHLNQLITTSTAQYKTLLDLHRSIHTRVEANLATANDMFVKLHSLAWNHTHPLPARFLRHKLSTYVSEDVGALLVLKECDLGCVCPTRTSLYKVWEDGTRAPDLFFNSSGSVFFLSAASLDLVVWLKVNCGVGESGGTLMVRGAAGEQTFPTEMWSLGMVADAGIFVDNNSAYIVTVGRLQEASNVTQAWVVVLRVSFDHRRVERVWGDSSTRSAAKLDLMQVGSVWYLLVVFEVDPHRTDRFSTSATLFVWSNQEEVFTLQRKYSGHHVSSAMFMRVQHPSEEHFFVLAQRRASNLHADTRVMVFRHDENTGMFEEFQVLPISDVVSQASLEVGSSPYLLLLSEEEHFNVYRYIPLEGFRLQQSVGVRGPVSLAVVEGESGGQQVWVSTEAPARLKVFSVRHKGIDPTKLY
ncbi:uncharacterized protein LOC126988145 [Eriocheir sinensis]|uniref:uncharacterized protein LOC126988145 n=1 Tax=Eriocheir sinensis TaxID=95602 RepID=UPI0021C64F9D|nr:uncharacterized protein LOC126988145 [Eriocheir sinensis]